jgi:hypothetical protein
VHGLRYALDPSRRADAGHGYLTAAPPLLAALLALGVAQLLFGAAGRRSWALDARRARWPVRWAVCSVALVALYSLQENAESISTYGQLAGPVALLAHGGWTVLPLVAAAGGLVAAVLRGTDAVLASALDAAPAAVRARLAAGAAAIAPFAVLLWPGVPELARHLAGRAPPRAS